MTRLDIEEIRAAAEASEDHYYEFLRVPSLSVGLYTIPAGGEDPQDPHTEDEVYYVLAGRARFVHGDETYPVTAGDCIYVEREVNHRFVDIEEDLETIVFFAPAEGRLAGEGE